VRPDDGGISLILSGSRRFRKQAATSAPLILDFSFCRSRIPRRR
jgi:hypothetical protein